MDLYQKLGIEKGASNDEIKKAYRKLSINHHPDKGGNEEKYKEINHAYEILGDEEKRQVYDLTGSEDGNVGVGGGGGFQGGFPAEMFMGGMGGIPFPFASMFGDMFGGGGMGGPPRRRKAHRGPDKAQDIPLSLADFYNGREIQIKFHQQRGCGLCKATGALKTEQCSGCRGSGSKISMRQIGPGMIQQSMVKCVDCDATGMRILQVCHECNAKKYRVHEKVLNAKIEPGMPEGEKLRFPGQCSDSPDYETPGDVVLNLLRSSVISDTDFEWVGNDLNVSHSVEIGEALLGFTMLVKNHPSGKDISLTWAGGPLQHDNVLVGKGLGMPIRGRKGEYGDLFVHVDVSVNNAEKKAGWTPEQREALMKAFPDWTPPEVTGVPIDFKY
jgi:DnaJ family protein A protein 2